MTQTFTMRVEKWVVRRSGGQYSGYEPLSERQVVCKVTPKRLTVMEGMDKGKVFDRKTGWEIKRRDFSWYRHSIKDSALA